MTAPLRKGWCPGALRPMAAKDGLLVRLRITGGILPARVARALADQAETFGNGLFDLSARGNLQMRGITEVTLVPIQDGLTALSLLDVSGVAEAVRNVIASPLAGLHDGIDVRPLTAALESRLTSDAALHDLPGKFGFVIDDGSTPSLAGIEADVRFDWLADDARFSIGLAGTRAAAIRVGSCSFDDLVENTARMARGAISLFAARPEAHRIRDLLASAGVNVVAKACGGRREESLPRGIDTFAENIVGWRNMAEPAEDAVPADRNCLGLAVPFGRLDAAMLRSAADLAAATPLGELRLTPWRTILVPGAAANAAPPRGFITEPSDPRLTVAACVGAYGCTRGTTDTHRDAAVLAESLRNRTIQGIAVHVSGCEKGCAKPSPTALTLVGRDGRYDLVCDGRAADPPIRHGLEPGAARDALRAFA